MTTLLQTKLHIPQSKAGEVIRGTLFEQLGAGLDRRLTLISAPAGFGKTSLLARWLRQLQDQTPVAPTTAYQIGWITLDERDNDPSRFLAYLTAAFTAALFAAMPQPYDAGVSLEASLIPIVNRLANINQPLLLALDDYHVIENQAIDEALTFLIDNAPPSLHIFITTRVDPLLPLARWRARQQLVELRADQLRFTQAETATLLQEVWQLPMSDADIASLDERTEGWLAALQMVGQSLTNRPASTIPEFIQNFSGSHRFVLDYLVEEVLARQPASIQRFLLHTSILNRLTAPLCNALLRQGDAEEDTDAQQILEQLEGQNLFTFALDDIRQWFRYHQLFSDFLRIHLQKVAPARIPELQRRAAQWFADAGLLEDALEHAFQADAHDLAAEWLAQLAPTLLQQGKLLSLKSYLKQLPLEIIHSDRRLAMVQAWAATAVMNHHDPEPDFDVLERLIKTDTTISPQRRMDLQCQVLSMRTTWAVMANQVERGLHYANLALERMPENAVVMRNLLTMQVGNARRIQGKFDASLAAYTKIVQQGAAVNDALIIFITHFQMGRVLRLLGNLDQAGQLLEQAIGINEQLAAPTPQVGLAHLGLAEVLWERWQVDDALRHLDLAVQLCHLAGTVEENARAHHLRACVYLVQNRPQAATDAMATAQQLLQTSKEADSPLFSQLYRLRFAMLGQDTEAIAQHLPQLDLDTTMAADLRGELRTRIAQAHLLLNQPTQCLELLTVKQATEDAPLAFPPIIATVLQAVAHHQLGNAQEAIVALQNALQLAATTGHRQSFVEMAAPLGQMVATYQKRLSPAERTRAAQLLGEGSQTPPSATSSIATDNRSPRAPQTTQIEALTARELEILHLIAAGNKNQEIADQLIISLNTVRYHTKQIFGKLQVNKRTQAVAQARQLGLLED